MAPGSGLLPIDSLFSLKLQIAGQITRGNFIYTLVTDPDLRTSWQKVRHHHARSPSPHYTPQRLCGVQQHARWHPHAAWLTRLLWYVPAHGPPAQAQQMCRLMPGAPGELATIFSKADFNFFTKWAATAESDAPNVWLSFGDFGSPGAVWQSPCHQSPSLRWLGMHSGMVTPGCRRRRVPQTHPTGRP